MCTQFHLDPEGEELKGILAAVRKSALAGRFAAAGKAVKEAGEVRPTDVVPVVASGRDGGRAAFPMRWGFRMGEGGAPVVNARVESAAGKSAFREAWAGHRCAIPAAWYYEWEHPVGADGKRRVGDKYRFRVAGGGATWLCGLYRMEGGLPVFAVLTREAPAELARIHERMPLVLPSGCIGEWIRPGARPEGLLGEAVTGMVAERVGGARRCTEK